MIGMSVLRLAERTSKPRRCSGFSIVQVGLGRCRPLADLLIWPMNVSFWDKANIAFAYDPKRT